MTLFAVIIYIILGFLAGIVAKKIFGYRRSGFIMTTILGLIGSFLGPWLFIQVFKIYLGSWSVITTVGDTYIGFQWFWAIIGSCLIILLGHLIFGRKQSVR